MQMPRLSRVAIASLAVLASLTLASPSQARALTA